MQPLKKGVEVVAERQKGDGMCPLGQLTGEMFGCSVTVGKRYWDRLLWDL